MTSPTPVAYPSMPLWRRRGLLALVSGEALSTAGTGASGIALLLLTLRLTNSAIWLAAIDIAYSVSAVLWGVAGAVVADNISRRSILLASNLLRAAVIAAMPLSLRFASDEPAAVAFLVSSAVLLGSFGAAFESTFNTVLPRLVPADRLPQANSFYLSAQNVALLIGTGAGGAIVALAGFTQAFELDAATYFASAAGVLAVARDLGRPQGRSTREARGRQFREGVSFLWNQTVVRSLLTIQFVAAVGGATFPALLVYRLQHELHEGSAVTGAVVAAASAGGILGTIAVGRMGAAGLLRGRVLSEGRLVVASVLSCGLLFLAMTLSSSSLVYAVLGAGVEASVWMAGVAALSMVQQITPDALLGRVMSHAQSVSWCGAMLSGALMGSLASTGGAGLAFTVLGAEMSVGALAASLGPLGRRGEAVEAGAEAAPDALRAPSG